MKTISETGGARVGWVNASWPFAKLEVTEEKLTLNATLLGKFVFKPSDIISITPYRIIPFFGRGIKINHKVANYNSKIIFWTFSNPDRLIEDINRIGFFNNAQNIENSEELETMQKAGGFPLKISFSIIAVLIWNLLSFIDVKALFDENKLTFGFGKGFVFSTGTIFIFAILLLISKRFQNLALKKNGNFGEIKSFVILIILVTGALFISRLFVDL